MQMKLFPLFLLCFLLFSCFDWHKDIPHWKKSSEIRIYTGLSKGFSYNELREAKYTVIKNQAKIYDFIHSISEDEVNTDNIQFDYLFALYDSSNYHIQDFYIYTKDIAAASWYRGDYVFSQRINLDKLKDILQ